MRTENLIKTKSFTFAIEVVKLYQRLTEQKREYVLSKQILRSGTAIGAMVREAEHAESKADFLHKMNVALKEANETSYWLILLKETTYLSNEEYVPIHSAIEEIIKMLASIVKTTKVNLNRLR
jgi:four helix bundle protein